jgi:hypothetical protein
VQTTETYDRHGRLVAVTEPAIDGTATGTRTSYTYDVANRLARVCMNDIAGCGQQRLFAYDNRGFLLSETHPEKGLQPQGNGTTFYGAYDARGHARNRYEIASSDPSNVTFVFDRAERLTSIVETNSGRPLKQFAYGANNTAGDFRNGQITSATRFNWFVADGFNFEVTDAYTYGGKDGRPSSHTTRQWDCAISTSQNGCTIAGSGTLRRTFASSFTYDDLGNQASATYPSFVNNNCGTACQSAPSAPTVTNTWNRGFLTGVTFPYNGQSRVNTIGYHASGLVASVAHANGVTDLIGADPYGQPRPASFSAGEGHDASACTPASISSHPASVSGNAGASHDLTVSAAGDSNLTDHPLQYQWYVGASGTTSAPISGGTFPSRTVTPAVTTQYWVRVWNDCGPPADSATATVTICSAPSVTSPSPSTRTITRGQTAALTISTASGNTIQWYEYAGAGNTARPVGGAMSSSLTVSPTVATAYWARVSNGCGSADSATASVNVDSPPLPPAVVVASTNGTSNQISWSSGFAAAGAKRYILERSMDGFTYTCRTSVLAPAVTATDDNATNTNGCIVQTGRAYLYRVRTVDNHDFESLPSTADVTVLMTFVDDPVIAFSTGIKGTHIRDLRLAVDAMRAAAGLSALWPNAQPPTGLILASNITTLRAKLDEARAFLGLPQITYAIPSLAPGTLIRAIDVNELRGGVK